MNAKSILLLVGTVIGLVALADLASGNSNQPILPAVIGDQLNQQSDLVLLAIAGGTFYFALR